MRFWVPPGSHRLTVLPWATLNVLNELKAFVLRMVLVVMSVTAPRVVTVVWVRPSVRMFCATPATSGIATCCTVRK